jgi:cyclic beta-1,2-glucan synthetase
MMTGPNLPHLLPEASPALRDILGASSGPVQPPIRAEIFGLERFAQHGRSLGDTHRGAVAYAGSPAFFPRLRDNIAALRSAHRYIGQQASTGYDISPAAEWLLDNFHLIEAQLEEIRAGLPRRYFHALPVLRDEPLAGLPRVYSVAWAFVAHTDSAFDETLLVQFLSAYQESCELTLGELWALPTTLRVVLVENLRRLAERVATNKAAREVANLCCDRLSTLTPERLDALLAVLERRGVGRAFLGQMAQRVHDRHADSDPASRVQQWLREALPDPAALQRQLRIDQTADNLSVSNAVTSLRAIGDADWSDMVASTSSLMRLLLSSPVFEAEHPAARDQTLHGIEKLARRSRSSEVAVAQQLLDLMHGPAAAGGDASASVPVHWLQGAGRPAMLRALGLKPRLGRLGAVFSRGGPRRAALALYLGAVLAGTGGLLLWLVSAYPAASALAAALGGALMALPASEAVVAVINRLISESARPSSLPRFALAGGIPPEHRVLVVIPAMLTDAATAAALAHRLRLHHLANPERHAQFALLTDWADADTANCPSDTALLGQAVAQVQALNAQYPQARADAAPRFILLHRERRFSETEQRWIGWERKRGKLEQLVAALATGESKAFLDLGETSRLAPGTPYIVTLDSDTELPPGRLRELVGVAAHPHNQPRLGGADGRRVIGGYGILQPRVATPLPAPKELTPYHWLFAGQCGIDPYSVASSEVYQDVFAEGSFSGKGLLHVKTLHAVLAGRLPEGQVLSHDLLEGSMARCAAVSDITVIEDAPFHADVAASRVHRWTRGDWQLLPFLLSPRRHGLRAVHCWKLFDNLRRSLVAPGSLLLLLAALGGAVPLPFSWALALVLAAFTAGPLMGAVAGLSPSRDDVAKRHFYRDALLGLARAVLGGTWNLALLLQHALMAADAVARALYRMLVSRRHLLQWTTAAAAQAQAKTRLSGVLRHHARVPLAAAALLGALLAHGTAHPWPALALCLLWALSPIATWWVSRPLAGAGAQAALPEAARSELEAIARDTWRYFERCVTAQDQHLPPDNFQTLPHEMLAHRTSPTNIGLYLLSAACARAFGWIGTPELLQRLEATLATLGRLQRHRGHFLNWYDTQTGQALLPMYVSAVDSGNLCGHLLAVAQACLELAEPHTSANADTDTRIETHPAFAERLRAVARHCEQLAAEADFSFLYHPKRHLLHIGFRVAEQQLDAGFYDLLASESRLTSLFAIAKGDVPVAHWAALGRPFFAVGAKAGLRSWSGSMFEYLMPTLVLAEPHGSVLREACSAALAEQVAYGREHRVPWGISESAHAERDHTLAYQYAPQGVPRLGLRRAPPDELVIAPYATGLAAQLDVHAALENFTVLQGLAPRERYGFIEALDFTPARQAGSATFTPVSTFMAHHQGMTLVALANVLLDGVAQRWGMANPQLQAVASLLHERVPREVPGLAAPSIALPVKASRRRSPSMLREVVPGATAVPPTHVLSNGRYSVLLRANGAGSSRWNQAGITRWRDDALRDACGSFFYWRNLRDAQQPQPSPLVSLTQHPAPDAGAHYTSRFHADRVTFSATWPGLTAHTTVWVSPEDDIEFRQVELCNTTDRVLEMELVSAFDVTLADPRADEAHPAFSNLFVRAEWRSAQQALVFTRTPRLATEQGLHAAHFVSHNDPQVLGLSVQTDRQHWLGRNRGLNQPLGRMNALPGEPAGAAPTTTLDTGLDPVCALAAHLRIEPHGKVQLTFATAASDNGGTLHAVIDKYRQPSHVQRASMMSATLAGIRLRSSRIAPEHFAAIQLLTTAVALSLTRPSTRYSAEPAADAQRAVALCDRRLLWRFGLSGDRPIMLVQIGMLEGVGLVRSLARALRLWARAGIACDLVVVNQEATSYQMALQHELAALRARHTDDTPGDPGAGGPPSTGFHVLRLEELSADEMSTLRALARLHLFADGRPLTHHVDEWALQHEQALEDRQRTSTTSVGMEAGAVAVAKVASGEFAPVSGEFRFDVSARQRTLKPWINVMANPAFGTQLSEAGGGTTWARNSRLMQLTAWSNDPVADPPSEWLLLQDLATHQTWSAAPSAWGDRALTYRVAHGQGVSSIRHRRGDLDITVTWCVDVETSVKQVRLRLVNRGHRTQQLRVVGLAEWMMGANRSDRNTAHTALYRQRLPDSNGADVGLGADLPQKLTALLCTQADRSAGFGGGTAFFAMVQADDPQVGDGADSVDWTCDRRECFDARGRLVLPDHFGASQGPGLDPCAALSTHLQLKAGDAAEQVFLLGYADDPDAARLLATRAAAASPLVRLEQVQQHWNDLLGATTVVTPDPLFDALVNRWLLYQTVSCRLWAKAAFYQAGGATGFRDQLQDTMALVWAAPQMLRAQILLCASRQFSEGDVQHWWHNPGGAGVRTHFSDDLLWLPYACAHYLRCTGDAGVLDETVPFIEGSVIAEGAEDAYNTPHVSSETASVYEHAARTIDRSLRVGAHGLPLMGSGDWNDGMNRVGIEGRGESVWLAWFLCRIVADFGPVARGRGDAERAQRWDDAAAGWKAALLGPAWDGFWFKRAFFDNGEPLGSHANPEAKIDLIAQAWAVLSQAAPPAMQAMALEAVQKHLVDAQAGLVRLLDPPLAHASPSAGYIQAYPPGVRENGGQYSHGAVWALMAQAQFAVSAGSQAAALFAKPETAADLRELPYRTFTCLSPAHRAHHPTHGAAYAVEPYVMAADVYTQPPYVGRGGWSWYTGAAGWMHRAAVESLFGLKQDADSLCLTPCLPSHWPEAELMLKRGDLQLRFVLLRATAEAAMAAMARRGADGAGAQLLLPGQALAWQRLAGSHCFAVPLLA